MVYTKKMKRVRWKTVRARKKAKSVRKKIQSGTSVLWHLPEFVLAFYASLRNKSARILQRYIE